MSILVADIDEQESGGYWGTLIDENGQLVPGNVLLTLTLSLYVVRADGTVAYVNGRNRQNVLNANNVLVYNTLQTRPDGVTTYNLFWAIQPEDTTLVEDLPFERHLMLWEWTWPNNHAGKHEAILNVKNLTVV